MDRPSNGMTAPTSLVLEDMYDLVGFLDEEVRKKVSDARILLVGGSAFVHHFPKAHASFDADMIFVAPMSFKRDVVIEIVESLGFEKAGKCWRKEGLWYTLEIFHTQPETGEISMLGEIESGVAGTGRTFPVLSATAMVFDRLVAVAHWNDMQSALKVNLAVRDAAEKIDFVKLAGWIRCEGILSQLQAAPDLKELCRHLESHAQK